MMNKKVPFLDLRIVDDEQRRALLQAVETVFLHGRLVMGPEVQELEKLVAERCGREFAVGVNSGTDALFLGLKALGIGPGHEVITTSLSWIATANTIALTGARPIFADIGDDLNLDPDSVERLITSGTKAIMPVHYTGKVCRMDRIMELAETHDLLVVEDACQAFDARYQGRKAGSFGNIACFSMNPMKVFAACGEAGLVATDSEEVYDRMVALRYNGTINKEECIEPSLNGRIDTLQAAILIKRLEWVGGLIDKRRKIAARYGELLDGIVRTPMETEDEWDVFYTYTIQARRRDELKAFLEGKGVETKIQHPILMPDQPPYRDMPSETVNAREALKRILCIPASEALSMDQVEYTAECIKEFYERGS